MTNLCILQVEDEQADIELLRFAFKKAGIQNPLHAVTDGQAAIDYLSGTGPFADREEFPLPSLVLLDLKLPKVTGLELLHWIRQRPRLAHTVIIVLSSSAQPADIQRAYDLGVNSFIQKPATFGANLQVAQALKNWWLDCNRYAPTHAAPAQPTQHDAP